MNWLVLMLIAALCQAVKDLCLKRGVRNVPSAVVVWAYCLGTTLFLLPVAAYQGVPPLDREFWIALGVTGPLAAVTLHLYVKALEYSDLSITAPMLTATPLFLLATSPLMVGEFPDPAGIVGIVCIVAGSYVLNLRHRSRGALEPFRALMRDRGARTMLLVAFLWSVSANIDKVGLRHSSPVFWIICAFGFTTVLLTPKVIRLGRGPALSMLRSPWDLTATGLLEALTCLCQMQALTMTLVPYVISVKRMSAVFAVLLGWLILREGDVHQRLAGSALMVLGVFLIAVLG